MKCKKIKKQSKQKKTKSYFIIYKAKMFNLAKIIYKILPIPSFYLGKSIYHLEWD